MMSCILSFQVKTDDKVAKGIRKNLEKLSGIMEDEAKVPPCAHVAPCKIYVISATECIPEAS